MESENILEEANRITATDRRQAYGSASVEFNRVANMWTAFLGDKLKEPLTAHDYGAMMVLLKVARYAVRRGRDDLVDISGYARTLEMVREGEVITRPVSDEVAGIEAELGPRSLEKSSLARKTYQELFGPIPQDADIEGLEELFDQNATVEPSSDDIYKLATHRFRKARGNAPKFRDWGATVEGAKSDLAEGVTDINDIPEQKWGRLFPDFEESLRALHEFNEIPILPTLPIIQYGDVIRGLLDGDNAGLTKSGIFTPDENQTVSLKVGKIDVSIPASVREHAAKVNFDLYYLMLRRMVPEAMYQTFLKLVSRANMEQTPALWLNQYLHIETYMPFQKRIFDYNGEAATAFMSFLDRDTLSRMASIAVAESREPKPISLGEVLVSLLGQTIEKAEKQFLAKPTAPINWHVLTIGGMGMGNISDQSIQNDVPGFYQPKNDVVGQTLGFVPPPTNTAWGGGPGIAALPASLIGDGEEQVLDFIEKEGAALSSRGPLLSEICVADGGIKKAEEYCGLCRRCLCSKCADWHKVRCGIPLTSDDPDQIRVELDYFAKKVVRPSNAEDLRWVDNTGFDIKPS